MEFATETRATRYLMEAPSMYRVEGDKTWHRGRTVNISESGVLLQAAGHLALRARVEMTFHPRAVLPEAISRFPVGQLTCVGEVVRHAPSTESIPYPVAARFVQFLDSRSSPEP